MFQERERERDCNFNFKGSSCSISNIRNTFPPASSAGIYICKAPVKSLSDTRALLLVSRSTFISLSHSRFCLLFFTDSARTFKTTCRNFKLGGLLLAFFLEPLSLSLALSLCSSLFFFPTLLYCLSCNRRIILEYHIFYIQRTIRISLEIQPRNQSKSQNKIVVP